MALAVMLGAAAGGAALFLTRDGARYESAPSITLTEQSPEGAVAATLDGVDTAALAVSPGTVIELTYVGDAANGHPPCGVLQTAVDGRWVTTHWLGSAYGAAPGAMWGDSTWDRAIEGSATTLVCPLMDMVGAGPERFRLPLTTPEGQARLCRGDDLCIELHYSG